MWIGAPAAGAATHARAGPIASATGGREARKASRLASREVMSVRVCAATIESSPGARLCRKSAGVRVNGLSVGITITITVVTPPAARACEETAFNDSVDHALVPESALIEDSASMNWIQESKNRARTPRPAFRAAGTHSAQRAHIPRSRHGVRNGNRESDAGSRWGCAMRVSDAPATAHGGPSRDSNYRTRGAMIGNSRYGSCATPKCRVLRPPKIEAGRSCGCTCTNGPTPVCVYLNPGTVILPPGCS